MEEMKMVIKRGMKDGRFDESNTLRYNDLSVKDVIEMLDDIADRIESGLKHMGTEVKAITVQSWTEIIKDASDVRKMADYYRRESHD